MRDHLKKQMEEKCAELKRHLAIKAKEADFAREVDRLALSGDRDLRIQHSKSMRVYRDENKRVSDPCIHYASTDNVLC